MKGENIKVYFSFKCVIEIMSQKEYYKKVGLLLVFMF